MPNRRKYFAGIGSLALGSGAVTSSVFAQSTTPDADLRVRVA